MLDDLCVLILDVEVSVDFVLCCVVLCDWFVGRCGDVF